MIEKIVVAIKEHFKEDFLGMASNEFDMTIGIKDKKIVIKDYPSKTIEEIIEELEGNNE